MSDVYKTYLINPDLFSNKEGQGFLMSSDDKLQELISLAKAINLEIAHAQTIPLKKIRPATYLGKGTVEQLGNLIATEEIKLVIFNGSLSPIQQRNLEKAWKAKVIDRTGLILEIFGDRARTREGVLQVELATLNYQRSRLVRSWTHLERQRGGFGFMGGPGESQLEIDRRLIQNRIYTLEGLLDQVKKTRGLHRKARRRNGASLISLVGYTNVGKSTLFNHLTHAHVEVKDQLFATLDPTMRGITLPSSKQVILSDTVGFISDLPTQLVAAFRATLEEVLAADILIHVLDASSPNVHTQEQDVLNVLEEIGVSTDQNIPELFQSLKEKEYKKIIRVYNKVDLLDEAALNQLKLKIGEDPNTLLISASTGGGCKDILDHLDKVLSAHEQIIEIKLGFDQGKIRSWLYEHAHVLEDKNRKNHIFMRISLDSQTQNRFNKMCTFSCLSSSVGQ